MGNRKITLDIGLNAIHYLGYNDDSINVTALERSIGEIKERGSRKGLDIETVPYFSINSSFSGGRLAEFPDFETLYCFVELINAKKIPVNLVFNGGSVGNISYEEDVDLAARTIAALDVAAENHGIRNFMTIYLDDLNKTVKKMSQNIATIASCIRFYTPESDESRAEMYQRSFEEFDLVVCTPQDLNPSFLDSLATDQMEKLVPMLNVGCDCSYDVARKHYESLERHLKGIEYEDTEMIEGCRAKKKLIETPEKIENLLEKGVSHFKYARRMTDAHRFFNLQYEGNDPLDILLDRF